MKIDALYARKYSLCSSQNVPKIYHTTFYSSLCVLHTHQLYRMCTAALHEILHAAPVLQQCKRIFRKTFHARFPIWAKENPVKPIFHKTRRINMTDVLRAWCISKRSSNLPPLFVPYYLRRAHGGHVSDIASYNSWVRSEHTYWLRPRTKKIKQYFQLGRSF